MALSSQITLAVVAEVFQYSAIVVCGLIVPYSIIALVWKEKHEKVRYVREHESAYYRPSLSYLTWLNWAFVIAIGYIVSSFALRLYLHVEPEADAGKQPPWSYALSMFGTSLLLLVFVMPSTFLFSLKRHIIEAPIMDVQAQRVRDIQDDVAEGLDIMREVQKRGRDDQLAEREDRAAGKLHRGPPPDE